MGGDGIMTWFNDLLQQGKGLYQQGTNWATGNNLTSQDPSVRNAMALDALGTNNQLQDESFSDLSYQDMEGVHPPRSHSGLQSIMPHDLGQNWRGNNAINYAGTYPQAPFQPNMLDVAGTGQLPAGGITATNEAQKKGNFFTNLLDNTILGRMAAMRNPLNERSGNYNPALQGQIDDLRNINFLGPTSEGYQIRGGPLAGKNLVSAFGTNDYDEMLQKKSDWFQARKDAEKGFSQKNWDKVIAEQKAREAENKARADAAAVSDRAKIEAHTGRPMSDYRASRPASERQFTGHGKSGMGRSADRFAAQGGYMRQGYSRGGRVGILSVF